MAQTIAVYVRNRIIYFASKFQHIFHWFPCLLHAVCPRGSSTQLVATFSVFSILPQILSYFICIFRDVAFYIISLLILVGTFLDEQVFWWEALALFAVYAAYALFMKFNASIEFCVKRHFGCRIEVEEEEMDQTEKQECKETALTSGREQLAQPTIAEV